MRGGRWEKENEQRQEVDWDEKGGRRYKTKEGGMNGVRSE